MSHYDCIILGAGPAGSTAAALLAGAGWKVCIVEKDAFPRFHIGESLLPAGNAYLRASGVWDKVEAAGFVLKRGAEFVCDQYDKRVRIDFRDGLEPGLDYTWQVRRAEFDQILLDGALERGAELRQPARVSGITDRGDQWQVTLASGETLSAHWFLDAGGRGRFLGTRMGLPMVDTGLPKRFAVYGHFRGVRRYEGDLSGNITIVRVPTGWFWSIPISEQETSIGWVAESAALKGRKPAEAFRQALAESPFMATWMREAESVREPVMESDYSFLYNQWAGERWMLAGDAAAFLDPVFSSGVYLAVKSGHDAARCMLKAGSGGKLSRREQRAYTREGMANLKTMLKLVRAFYHERDFSVFLHPKDRLSLVAAVNSVVAGRARLNFPLWWRFELFLLICRVNRVLPLAPRLPL